jgi:hypothetical protein
MEPITHIPYLTAASHVITYTSKHSKRILEGINKQQMIIVYLSPQIKLKIKLTRHLEKIVADMFL